MGEGEGPTPWQAKATGSAADRKTALRKIESDREREDINVYGCGGNWFVRSVSSTLQCIRRKILLRFARRIIGTNPCLAVVNMSTSPVRVVSAGRWLSPDKCVLVRNPSKGPMAHVLFLLQQVILTSLYT